MWKASSCRPPPEVHDALGADGADPLGSDRSQIAEESIHVVSEDPMGTREQLGRIDEVAGALLLNDDLGMREGRGDVAHAAGVIEMDVSDHDRGEILRADAEGGEGPDHLGRAARGSRLHQAWSAAADEVARGDALVSAHAGIDVEHVVPEILDEVRRRGWLRHGGSMSRP